MKRVRLFGWVGEVSVVVIALAMLVLVVLAPWAVIWAWNTLFGSLHEIAYTAWTWLAVIVLGVFLRMDLSNNDK